MSGQPRPAGPARPSQPRTLYDRPQQGWCGAGGTSGAACTALGSLPTRLPLPVSLRLGCGERTPNPHWTEGAAPASTRIFSRDRSQVTAAVRAEHQPRVLREMCNYGPFSASSFPLRTPRASCPTARASLPFPFSAPLLRLQRLAHGSYADDPTPGPPDPRLSQQRGCLSVGHACFLLSLSQTGTSEPNAVDDCPGVI